VDHKTHKQLPGHTFRTLDAASPLYIWAARESGHDVRGFLWNYLRTKAPSVPKMVYVGKPQERLSSAVMDTDYPTYARAIRDNSLDHTAEPYRTKLRHYKSQRWVPGAPQTSPFFQRVTLEKDDEMVARAVATAMRTRDRMHGDYDDWDVVERNMGRPCDWCRFRDICTTEMFGGNGDHLRRVAPPPTSDALLRRHRCPAPPTCSSPRCHQSHREAPWTRLLLFFRVY
jgi:hypothetical protein